MGIKVDGIGSYIHEYNCIHIKVALAYPYIGVVQRLT